MEGCFGHWLQLPEHGAKANLLPHENNLQSDQRWGDRPPMPDPCALEGDHRRLIPLSICDGMSSGVVVCLWSLIAFALTAWALVVGDPPRAMQVACSGMQVIPGWLEESCTVREKHQEGPTAGAALVNPHPGAIACQHCLHSRCAYVVSKPGKDGPILAAIRPLFLLLLGWYMSAKIPDSGLARIYELASDLDSYCHVHG